MEFADGMTNCLPLKDVKDSNPIDLAENAIASQIDQEPTLKWWVPLIMHK